MEQKVKLYPTDNFIHEFHANIAASCHLIAKQEGKRNIGWYNIRLDNHFNKFMTIDIRAIEVIEGDTPNALLFQRRVFIRYEVKKNPWYIEFLEFRRGEGFVAIGEKMNLFRTPPLYELVNY